MRGKLWFIGGLAAGFVLGARAGREKYEEIVQQARKVMDNPTVQEAKGTAQAQANRLMSEGKDRLSHSKLGEKMSSGTHDHNHAGTNGLTSSTTSSSSAAPTKPMP
ncbi:hypothetical protein [Asanoa iriomotensis]|uniref:YtxH domain-containing protein n=1 Tax=Asanoa iriomotensis TaxID=234613 RepID=A0ABQ4C8V7_9ACTN|nr:hypothetical protein [Asanoa iriomotensis]GIF59227.1 hypothetical protein Air01nite_53220 [Asanoa iriomotensis]